MTAYLGEFLGTMLLVLLGDGVCANVNLNKSNFKNGGLVIVTIGWGMAVLLQHVSAISVQHLITLL